MNINKLKELCEAATPGPWEVKEDECDGRDEAYCYWHKVGPFSLMGKTLDRNSKFIAQFNPAFVSKLLAVVEAAKYEVNWGRCRKELTAAIAALEETE